MSRQFISDLPQPSKAHRALIPEQQPLADLLGNVPQWDIRVRIVCAKCSERIGLVLETLVTVDGVQHLTNLGPVLRAARYDEEQAKRWREDVAQWGRSDGRRLNDLTIYHAFLEHPTAKLLPPTLPIGCGRHGDRRISRWDLATMLDEARNAGGAAQRPMRA